ncbi:hypothetical protein [Zhihengliuella flava]|uniref:Uncharacterized protein n=1 Tax=Zhihengliuella flava TaxID=1285193 RepID=A0A931DAJ7_9MICC|nr:hypothetical protein [Zhihengliuella flava]MBG6084942.1 hypothetical protein [Zhihengliuella flava]
MKTIQGWRGILTFDIDEPWIAVEARPEVELMATLPPVEGEFVPNIVVTVNPFDGTLADFSRRALAAVERDLREGRIVDVGDWAYTFAPDAPDGTTPVDDYGVPAAEHVGRVVEYTHRAQDGSTVYGADYLILLHGWAIQASTTTSLPARLIFDDVLQDMARSVTVLRAPEEQDQSELTAMAAAVQDDVATSVLGGDREALFDHTAAGSTIGEGVWMTGEALQRTAELQEAVVGRLGAGKDAVVRELERLGVLENGRLGDLGEVISVALTDAQVRVRLTGRFTRGETHFQAFIIGSVAVVAAEQGYGPRVLNQPWHPDDPARFNVQILPLAELSSAMLRWVGAGPAWNLHLEEPTITPDVFEERLAGEAVSQPADGAVLSEVWQQPWFTWVLEIEINDPDMTQREFPPLTFTNTGPRGHYRVGTLEMDDESTTTLRSGDVLLWPTESGFIFRQLEDYLQAAILGRPLVLG